MNHGKTRENSNKTRIEREVFTTNTAASKKEKEMPTKLIYVSYTHKYTHAEGQSSKKIVLLFSGF